MAFENVFDTSLNDYSKIYQKQDNDIVLTSFWTDKIIEGLAAYIGVVKILDSTNINSLTSYSGYEPDLQQLIFSWTEEIENSFKNKNELESYVEEYFSSSNFYFGDIFDFDIFSDNDLDFLEDLNWNIDWTLADRRNARDPQSVYIWNIVANISKDPYKYISTEKFIKTAKATIKRELEYCISLALK